MPDFDHLDDFSVLLRRFDEKFTKLRKKVHRVLENNLDEQSYDIYVNSILIDCRALFIENIRYKHNCTIQNFYKVTQQPDFAQAIDAHFDGLTSGGLTLREVIKSWVDRHLVHFDFVDEKTEQAHFDDLASVLDRRTIANLFVDILLIAQQYSEYRLFLHQQAYAVCEALTGDG
ncbi:hypothetical protein [Pseudoduganella violacea]|uniref:Uncharacterized protein n=1 Tax=Pseudoduganella violacea TaxID=1715466 RepID=A0A7W5B7N3_9BURK|nr:hypothetical protein [Pseudoduganella violacea]MBB3118032.1 hypothetical protein [Pseudoduganella violacea]